jgi:predicted HTH domain antitoxin
MYHSLDSALEAAIKVTNLHVENFFILFATIINCKRGLEMLKTVATRISSKLEEEITKFMEEEGMDKSTAIRRLLEIGVIERKKKRAIELYRSGKITLWKASQISGISLREMLEELNRLQITTHVTTKDLEEDIEAAKKAEA